MRGTVRSLTIVDRGVGCGTNEERWDAVVGERGRGWPSWSLRECGVAQSIDWGELRSGGGGQEGAQTAVDFA